ncbi:MAG: ATP:cob(I)alamin adenosyltransferase [Caldilineaceae bacterium SB0662_bin_9]|uniref:Corrinoid adenosyltransferase n=1 Tax=Caldilineaceae bacterium SB0662_bin_9 TaxID=2605258 RepID=A0A6B1DU24_9CHLR|nr:ATP:cob(I)alamin adenosyltransferase [Caldilineaceae bacterium SB0662_bin_9]
MPDANWSNRARTICRWAKRRLVTLDSENPVRETCLHYLNRLSDTLFMWARLANQAHHQPVTLWDATQH